jgi:hypothetical protein
MFVKILGALDLIVAGIFCINNNLDSFNGGGWFPNSIVIYAGLYLLFKGLLFCLSLDVASIIDVISAIIILISLVVPVSLTISAFIIIYLVIKGGISWAG